MNKIRPHIRLVRVVAVISAFVLVAGNLIGVQKVFATTFLSKSSVILTNMDTAGASAVIFEFTTSSANTGTSLTLGFTNYTGSTNGTIAASPTYAQTFNSVNCKTITGAANNLPGTVTATGNAATGLFTFSSMTALTASSSYCGVLTGAITANPTATGQQPVVITAGTDAAQTVETDIISNDQVTVNASVAPSFTLALSGSSDNLGGLSGTVVGTTGITATVNTNAKNGWYLWGSDANTGLHSTTQSYTIGSTTPGTNTTLSSNVEGYLTGLPAGGITQGSGAGTTSATTAYASSGTGNGSGLDGTPRQIASSTGTANGAIVTFKEFGAVAPTTPAATDYTDTITVVGAGSF
jgi:hypothetical protein